MVVPAVVGASFGTLAAITFWVVYTRMARRENRFASGSTDFFAAAFVSVASEQIVFWRFRPDEGLCAMLWFGIAVGAALIAWLTWWLFWPKRVETESGEEDKDLPWAIVLLFFLLSLPYGWVRDKWDNLMKRMSEFHPLRPDR